MSRSSSRTFLTYAILLIASMVLIGFLLVQITKKFTLDAVDERVSSEGSYIVNLLNETDNLSQSKLEQVGGVSDQLDLGVLLYNHEDELLLNTAGQVSDNSPAEINRVIQNNVTELDNDKRILHEGLFYTKEWLVNHEGYIVFVLPTDSVTGMTANIWLFISVVLLMVLIVIFIIGYHFMDKYVRPIRSASQVARQLAEGNYNARTYETQYGETGQLTNSINLLARNLYEMNLQREIQNDRLMAVVENMDSGLILINEKGYIQLVNRAFLNTFKGESSSYLGYLYYEALSYEDVHDTVRDVFMFEKNIQKTMVVSLDIERRFFMISGAPIFNHSKEWKGVVLVFHDITDLKRLEEMRKDFVANVSHELKTPITSIKGFAETLLGGAQEDPEVREQFLSIIYKESGRLQLLISDLLELSKLEKEDLQLNIQKVTIRSLIDDVLSLVRHSAEEKEIEINVDVDPDLKLEVDSSRFTQLLLNLVTNAIHYTPEGEHIYINMDEHENDIKLTVRDTGIGIPSEHLPRIFERFYRVDKARSRNSGGTGLGLAIVKHIVEAHNGKIEVESEVNKGTTFSVILPKEFTNPSS
ncbi:two-component system, OmpR family, phosphate regulon sensor histidine kinase PhoR [Salinibacillus kushneri]|uniref:Phosphate regulon sensor protein PhoR n=1 Tax=Salinibacillus kushneri TaxID=237682 RepID=A0A1I0H670_9BACI|nr:HAMP domain-containing sensor histidine kinase [Salinibacillus kushneri]SET79121.1 two-component system, OmpR family, phosphate regulon sensor histidine kinase PhoR [Salinibacillus kushneri]